MASLIASWCNSSHWPPMNKRKKRWDNSAFPTRPRLNGLRNNQKDCNTMKSLENMCPTQSDLLGHIILLHCVCTASRAVVRACRCLAFKCAGQPCRMANLCLKTLLQTDVVQRLCTEFPLCLGLVLCTRGASRLVVDRPSQIVAFLTGTLATPCGCRLTQWRHPLRPGRRWHSEFFPGPVR